MRTSTRRWQNGRRWVGTAIAGLAIATASLLAKADMPVCWNRYHLKLDNSAFNDSETTLTADNVSQLTLAWEFDAGAPVWSSPAVSGNRVIVGVGDANGTLWVLDRATGTVLTSIATGQNIYGGGAYSTPTVEGDVIYYEDAGGGLVKYDLASNQQVFYVQPPINDAGFSSPAVWNGKVYAGLSNGTGGEPCTVGMMQAFDKNTGQLLWSWEAVPTGYVGGGIWNSPAIDTSRNLVIFATGNPPNKDSCGIPIPDDTPGDYTDSIVALDADTGALQWYYKAVPNDKKNTDFGGSSVLLFNDGTRDLASAGEKNGIYYAVDRTTGTLAWAKDLNDYCGGVNSCGYILSPAGAAYGKVFLNIGSADADVYSSLPSAAAALDMSTGAVLWQTSGTGAQIGGPAIGNDIVYMGLSNSLAAFDQATGAVLFSYPTTGQVDDSPAVLDGEVYFGSTNGYYDGHVYALKLAASGSPVVTPTQTPTATATSTPVCMGAGAGTPCDDGIFCNGADTCDGSGTCTHDGDPCAGSPVCTHTCNETTQNCIAPTDTSCDDGLFCNGADTCDESGTCMHAGDPCLGTVCNTCQEATDSCFDLAGTACTPDTDVCTEDVCDGSGTCTHPDKPDDDCDGICTAVDNCATIYNPDQLDCDCDGFGNVCDIQLQRAIVQRNTSRNPLKPNGKATLQAGQLTADAGQALQACLLTQVNGGASIDITAGASFHAHRALTNCVMKGRYIQCVAGGAKATLSPLTSKGQISYRFIILLSSLTTAETGTTVPQEPLTVSLHQCGIDRGDAMTTVAGTKGKQKRACRTSGTRSLSCVAPVQPQCLPQPCAYQVPVTPRPPCTPTPGP